MSLTIREIKRAVARYYDVTVSEMDSPRRAVPIVRARHVAMHLCRMFTRRSYPEIGAAFGGKDHTTVLHACNKMASRLENDRTLAIEVRQLAAPMVPKALPPELEKAEVTSEIEERIVARAAKLAADRITDRFSAYLKNLAKQQTDDRVRRAASLDEAMQGVVRAAEAFQVSRFSPTERGAREQLERATRRLAVEYRSRPHVH